MQTAIFGGSFNPPHNGHIEAATAAIKQLGVDRMIVIPAARAPHKDAEPNCPDPCARLKMTRLAFEGLEKLEVSDAEIERGGISYTVDTVENLKKQSPEDTLYLLMGEDQISTFESWMNFKRIIELCTLVPFPRREGDMSKVSQSVDMLQKKYGASAKIIDFTPMDISSTELRELLPNRQGSMYFRDAVYSEIIRHRWYGAKPELSWLRDKTYAYLDEKRIPHVAGCEEEAVRLAQRWGADEDMAAEAAILHDITKKLKLDEQLKLCERYGIMTDNDERANYKLLHSKTGAHLARELFGIPDEIYNAIYWHTTGKEGMSLLEKIVYMADYIEPTRHFDGVLELRRLAYEDIDEALILGFKMSLEELERNGLKPHSNSEKAMNWLVQHKN